MIPLFAQSAASTSRTVVEFARLRQFTEWWHWMLLLTVCIAILAYVLWMNRRDTATLPRGIRFGLCCLRIAVFIALLVFYFSLEKRSERELTRHSRVAVVVDTSQSMGLVDVAAGDSTSRLQQVIDAFQTGPLLADLQAKHDVVTYRFDQNSEPEEIAAFARPDAADDDTVSDSESISRSWAEASRLYRIALTGFSLATICWILHALVGRFLRGAEGEAYLVLLGTLLLITSVVVAAVGNLRNPSVPIRQSILRGTAPASATSPPTSARANTNTDVPSPPTPAETDWNALLAPRGIETRLGEAIQAILRQEATSPLAGIIVLTDGCHNAGVTPETVVENAKRREVPVFPIGLGSERQPKQVRLVDFQLPSRVYPGDRFSVTGFVQANGLAGQPVRIVVTQKSGRSDGEGNEPLERRLVLGGDGEVTPIEFEILPEAPGTQEWSMRIEARGEDDLDDRDNEKSGTVQVVERKSRVLLLAGGPTREYRFLRNLLFRDPTTQVDVLLQSAPPGAAQEANEVRLDFPVDRDEMFQYDCVVAFDPDWTAIGAESITILDEWVADKAGGLILVAGPVHTQLWSRGRQSETDDDKIRTVRNLYPVSFYRSGAATIQLGRTRSDTAWPLLFTDEGRRAPFLWLEDSAAESDDAWSRFAGVYGYQALRGVKPGGQVYARFSDPDAATSDEKPIYMAGQFYGTGRTFYLGSGEMWRLNALNTKYFEKFYTKLIRYVSQGRLLRDSSRGLLLVDKEECQLGDTITVRASLSDAQYRPLELETVPATVTLDDGSRKPLVLRRLAMAERPGMYSGQFTATRDGTHRINLVLPDSEAEVLTREVKARVPAKEIENSQRNDALLRSIADKTAGAYYVGMPAVAGKQAIPGLASQLLAKDQVTVLPGTPDQVFERRLMAWLLAVVCGLLCLEWLIRRLYRLA